MNPYTLNAVPRNSVWSIIRLALSGGNQPARVTVEVAERRVEALMDRMLRRSGGGSC